MSTPQELVLRELDWELILIKLRDAKWRDSDGIRGHYRYKSISNNEVTIEFHDDTDKIHVNYKRSVVILTLQQVEERAFQVV